MYVLNITLIPSKLTLLSGENYNLKKLPGIDIVETLVTSSSSEQTSNLNVNLFGIDVKDVTVNVLDNIEVVPVGSLIGLKLYTNGVLIVGMSEIENINHETEKPYENLDIQAGDTILKVNNLEIEDIDSLKREINNSNGENLNLTILKANGTISTSNIKPVKVSAKDYKLGLWVKDAATGVGTLTYYNIDTKEFAALGHGITDTDTDSLIQIDDGEVVTSKVLSIQKAEEGKPGEIKGSIINQQTIGKVYKNTEFGIFGELSDLSNIRIDFSKKMPVALRTEIEEGKATIMCSLDGKNVEEYEINIDKIYLNNNEDNKSMQIEITDSKLLEKTGGIIRGLSGAPIIQNGKFIGAVTNVLVNSPNKGYAIFADIMVKEMEKTD
jgi:stage IV sporulation protein B